MEVKILSITRDFEGKIVCQGIEEIDRSEINCLYFDGEKNYIVLGNSRMIETPHNIDCLQLVFDL